LRLLPILIQAAGGRPEQNMSNSVKTVAGTLGSPVPVHVKLPAPV